MAMKVAHHRERLAESGPYECTVEAPEDKYGYLLKQDWDQWVVKEPHKTVVDDFRAHQPVRLTDLSQAEINMPC